MTKFKPGKSGNPTGRPRGSINRQLAALREAADKVLPLVVEKALAGDADAQKLILTHALPKVKPMSPAEPFSLPEGDLSQQVQAILRQVADGELSPSIAAEIVGMAATAAKVGGETNVTERILEGIRRYEDSQNAIKNPAPSRRLEDLENG